MISMVGHSTQWLNIVPVNSAELQMLLLMLPGYTLYSSVRA